MKRPAWLPHLLIALAALAVYANALWNGFALDDNFIIRQNARVHQLADLAEIWLTPYWPIFGQELGLYRPFAIFAYALQWAVADGAAWLFHAVSLVLHALVSVLAFLLLRRFAGTGPALVGALVFAVHPVHTEVVANVVGQAELIAAAALLGACLIHASRPAGAAVGWGRRSAIIVLFALGMLTKESAIVLPALLLVIDVAQSRVTVARGNLAEYARGMAMPLILLAATAFAYLTLRIDVVGSIGGVDAAPQLPFLRENPGHRLLTGLRAWPEYVRLLFFPADLSSDYSPAVILPVESITPMALFGGALMLVTVLLALMTPWAPIAGLPAAWFFITMFPTSNLVLPIGVMVAERLLYTPSFAAAWIAAFAWQALVRARPSVRARRLATAALGLVLALMAIRTWVRNPDWKDTPAVWHALVRDHPESYRSAWILATMHANAGRRELGMEYFRIANRLWPNDSQLLNELAFDHLGRLEFDQAIPLLERSRELVPFVARTDLMLAHAYIGAGRAGDALAALDRAERHGGQGGILWPLRAQAFERLGDTDRAIAAWRITMRDPLGQFWNYKAMLARALARAGLADEALTVLANASADLPEDDSARATLHRLRAAVTSGCFASATPPIDESDSDRCHDPLAGWSVLVPIPVVTPIAPESGPDAAPFGAGRDPAATGPAGDS